MLTRATSAGRAQAMKVAGDEQAGGGREKASLGGEVAVAVDAGKLQPPAARAGSLGRSLQASSYHSLPGKESLISPLLGPFFGYVVSESPATTFSCPAAASDCLQTTCAAHMHLEDASLSYVSWFEGPPDR